MNKLRNCSAVCSRIAQVSGVGVVRLTAADVVRHPLVQRIIDAYKGRERGAGNGEVAP